MGDLIVISNHHRHEPPHVEEAPDRYIGYFSNVYGEQWVFVREHGGPTATLYGGDVAWGAREISSRDLNAETRRQEHGAFIVDQEGGGLIVNESEVLWLTACWFASNIS